MGEMNELLERVRSATGPDREIDWLVAEVLGQVPAHTVREVGWDHDWYRRKGEFMLVRFPHADDRAGCETWVPAPITASVDANLALIAKEFPGWAVQLFGKADGWMARLRSPRYDLFCTNIVDGEERRVVNGALALCCAFLAAKLAAGATP